MLGSMLQRTFISSADGMVGGLPFPNGSLRASAWAGLNIIAPTASVAARESAPSLAAASINGLVLLSLFACKACHNAL